MYSILYILHVEVETFDANTVAFVFALVSYIYLILLYLHKF